MTDGAIEGSETEASQPPDEPRASSTVAGDSSGCSLDTRAISDVLRASDVSGATRALKGLDLSGATRQAFRGVDVSSAMSQMLKGLDVSGATRQALKGVDVSSAMSQMLKGLDVSGATRQALKGVDVSSAMSQMLKGLDVSGATRQALKGVDVSSAMSQMLKGLDSVDFVTRVVGDGFTRPSMHSAWYDSTAHGVLAELGLEGLVEPDAIRFTPSLDDAAYAAFEAHAPDVAQAIDAAAERVVSPFWSRSAVRNSLAWLVASVVVILYVGGTVLWPPWGALVVALASASGVTAPSVYRSIASGDNRPMSDS